MTHLVDTNVLVYRFDPRDPKKQTIAEETLRRGIAGNSICIAQQCLVEFVAATTRPMAATGKRSLLSPEEAAYEAEDLERQIDVLYPCAGQFRCAIRGWRTYGLSWFDAHLWSFAEHFEIPNLLSEDFQHDRIYGGVHVHNPFLG